MLNDTKVATPGCVRSPHTERNKVRAAYNKAQRLAERREVLSK
jgi:hypothetical protein